MNLRRPLILASSSPRRQFLMREAGFQFAIEPPEIDESFPTTIASTDVPAWLASKKASVFLNRLNGRMVLTADTVVILGKQILNKPADRNDAIQMLQQLSGQTHLVITAVCLLSEEKTDTFQELTWVTFKKLDDTAIQYYVDRAKPFDKAGAYGAQECLETGANPCSEDENNFLRRLGKQNLIEKSRSGEKPILAAIDKIEGSYFNVMGLPIHVVYDHIASF